jgi:hypothetical protein
VPVRDAYFGDPMMRQFFGLPASPLRERIEQSLGSGVIVDAAKGYVLTNNHVVGGADDITVTLQDGRTFKGKLIGADPETDVAVVRIPAQNLTALPLADSSKLRVGDYVVAVGEPFGPGRLRFGELGLPELHPDRRLDQPRQLRRRAGQPARRTGRHQHDDLLAVRRQRGHRLRDPQQPHQRGDGAVAGARQGAAWQPGRADPGDHATHRQTAEAEG